MYGLGKRITGFDFTGDLAGMQDVINYSPQMTTMFLQGLKAQLEPEYAAMRRDTINTLAAQGQLDSSVLPAALAEIEQNKQNQYIQQSTQFGLADIQRAMQNRMSLFGTGLNTMQYGTEATAAEQARLNQFNLQNYGNAAKKWEMEAANTMWQYNPTGGIMGAATGGLSGALGGASAGPAGMLLGGLGGGIGGYYAPQGYGASIGSGFGVTNPFTTTYPGSSSRGLRGYSWT